MFPPFDEQEALAICRTMLADVAAGHLVIQREGREPSGRADGVMLGAMTCTDGAGAPVVLKTLSGISHSMRYAGSDDAVLVPPVVAPQDIEAALSLNDGDIHRLTAQIGREKAAGNATAVAELKRRRKTLTGQSLAGVFSLYRFSCADGTVRSLGDICGSSLPPAGTGDCCAPKLLHYAFSHGLVPRSMCEVFCPLPYRDATNASRAEPCAPCDARCSRILPAMLGLDIVYRDDDIIVINKPSGLLSVPGRGPDKQDCVANRVRRLFPGCIAQPAVHRLDMETSGLMVLAFTKDAHRELSRQFEAGTVHKQYEALLDGVLARRGIATDGTMTLYCRLDVEHRPHQIWDAEHGKRAVTEWHILGTEKHLTTCKTARDLTRVRFVPHTGRTHQLRLASAERHGFGVPIAGDSLYGDADGPALFGRLMLHATTLRFTHPTTGAAMEFASGCPF